MAACPRYRKTLWLDVYNELADDARLKWDAHLRSCDRCQEEKERMTHLIATMQENLQPPPTAALAPEDLYRTGLTEVPPLLSFDWWRQHFFGNRLRLVPALATFAMLLLVAGVVSYRTLQEPISQTASHSGERFEQVVNADAEMLKNLNLLKDMETVQQLILVIDKAGYIQPNPYQRDNTQGKRHHEGRKTYV